MKNLILLLCSPIAAVPFLTAAAAEFPLSGSGTAESPYLITSATDWNSLADYMSNNSDSLTGKTVVLTASIDFTGDTIKPLPALYGALQGNGYTLSGISITGSSTYFGGLVLTLGAEGSISDVTVEGSMTIEEDYSGGVIGRNSGGKISGVTSNLNIKSEASRYVGGIVGYCNGGTVEACAFGGSLVHEGDYAAGIAGYALENASLTGCWTDSLASVETDKGAGVVAYASSCEITGCVNRASVTAYFDCSGGVVGQAVNCTVTGCVNYGTCQLEEYRSGCVVGYANATPVSGCVNYGNGTLEYDQSGGVVGCTNSTVDNCSNYGDIDFSFEACGGVVGLALSGSTVTNCYNYGAIAGKREYLGGVVGRSNTQVSQCANYGTVSSSYEFVGGVVGLGSLITNCSNYGTVSSSSYYSGGVIGLTSSASVDSCFNYGDVVSTNSYSGGIIGNAAKGTYTNCYNYGTVTTTGICGSGLMASVEMGVTISDCGNYGTLTYNGTKTSCYLSGCFGYALYGTYTNCFNEGKLSSSLETASYISGVFGYLASEDGDTFVINGCYNTSDITGYNYVAGLVTNMATLSYITMSGCYNTGCITITAKDTTTSAVAGLLTYCAKNSSYSDCWNSGDITSAGADCAAGLFGYRLDDNDASSPISITGCYNTGRVTSAGNYAGGVFGKFSSGYITIADCHNTAEVSASGSYVGGIGGFLACGTSNSISRCYNLGTVSSQSGSAVAGIVGCTSASLADVYNSANVSGADNVAAIVGLTVADSTTIATAYSNGIITATSGTAGNIIGVSTADTAHWTSSNSMNGTYYLTANALSTTDTYSTGLTYAGLGELELDGWTNGDSYTYPRLDDNDCAKAHAAAVIPAEGDSYSSITQAFAVGTPDGVAWTASTDAISFDGNTASFTQSASGTVTLTATCGEATVNTEITCNVEVDGVGGIPGDKPREVVSEQLYTVGGQPVTEPAAGGKAVYIVTRTYGDGTIETAKEVR